MRARLRLPSPGAVYCVAVLVFLFLPVAFVVLFSFNAGGTASFPIRGFTTAWYERFFDDSVMTSAALNSLQVAAVAAAATIVLGTLAAFALIRYRVHGASAFVGLLVLPIVVPALLVGIALLSFFSETGIKLSLWTVTIGHVLITLPFVALTLTARLSGLDPALDEAAASLGATPLQRLRHVTIPMIRPSLVAAALLVVAISLDEFIVTFFTVGQQSTLPIVIWGQMRAGISPVVNAVSTLLLVATLLLVLVVRRLTGVRFR